MHEIIGDAFCEGNYCGSVVSSSTHPKIQTWSQILFSPFVGTTHQILNGFRVFGEISATLIGIFMMCKIIYVCGRKVSNKYLKVPGEEIAYLENIRQTLQIHESSL